MHGAFLFCRKSPAAFSGFRFISFHFISFHFTSYCSPVPLLSFTRRCYLMIILLFLSVCTHTLEGSWCPGLTVLLSMLLFFRRLYNLMLCAPFLKECSLSLYAGNFYLSFMCPDTHHVFPYQLHRALVVIYLVVIQRSVWILPK